jgi:hypothetical protein
MNWICIGLLFVVYSCTWKKEFVNVMVKEDCDTTLVSYQNTIRPILENNCYSCHSTSTTQMNGGLDIENFSSFKNYLSRNGNGMYGSQFINIINQKPGYLPMPPAYILTNCEISKIKSWINKGGLDN